MNDGRPDQAPEAEADTEAAPSEDSAFERLLHEAAKVSSRGPLLAPGTRLREGRFVIRRRLGEGGMGVVFEALDTRSGTTVALKTLTRVDAAGIYRMKHEFRSLAGVSHPCLVPPYELFADGELWFFTMSLVDGVRFDRYLASTPAELRAVLAQLCAGVQAIHDAGMLHRDLKPSNVLVVETADGPRVAILDFGLTSEASSPGATQTIERGVAGTPAYMAPEQARGQRATTASDWYAVGVMLFEALTGCLPFEGESLEQLVSKQMQSAPPVRSRANDAPRDLAELCDALLATDPAARPQPKDIHRVAQSDVELRTGPSAPSTRAPRASTSGDSADLELPSAQLPETFVGRAREIGQLETALGDTNQGKPVFVRVAGPSGIGKTTFVEHFLSSAKSRGDAVVLAGRCYERESVPFKGFDGVIDALSRYLVRLPDADAARLVPRHAQTLSRVFPVLGRVPAIVSAPQRRGLPSGGVELRYRAFESLKELLAKLAEERPLILSIDDLQWSDRDSARLLKHLLTPPDPPMLLLLATYRDDEPDAEGLVSVRQALAEPDAQQAIDVRTIELAALSAAESRRLAQQLLPPGERNQVERVAREAAGSPFLLGELTRAAQEGNYRGDLRGAILTRVASLPESRRALLHAVCVAPRPVAPELLSQVVAGGTAPAPASSANSDAAALAELQGLLSARLMREVAGKSADSARSGRRVAPYHDRIRETVLDALPDEQKADWHRRYVAALEGQEPLDLDGLSAHALGAGDHEKGGDFALRAARKAAEALAFDRAVALYETALSHLPLANAARAELLVELAQARAANGRCGDAARTFLEAAELDPSREQELSRRAGEQFFINGEVAAGAGAMRRALTSAGLDYDAVTNPAAVMPDYLALLERGFDFEQKSAADVDPARLARLETLWAAALGTTWLLQVAGLTIAYVREALEVGEPLHVARGRALLLSTFEAPIDPPGARRRLPELLAFLEPLDTPMTRAWAALCRAAVTLWSGSGDLGLADFRHAEELLTLPENRGMVRELGVCRTGLLVAMIDGGQMAEARDLLVQYIRLADETGDRYGRMQMRCAFAALLYGRLGADRVRSEIDLGLELISGLEQPRMRGGAWVTLACLEAIEGNLEQAHRLIVQTFGRLKGRDWDSLRERVKRAYVLLFLVEHGVGDRAALLAHVARDAALLARPVTLVGDPIDFPVLAGQRELLQGQLAAAAGQRQEAIALFEAAVAAARAANPSSTVVHVGNARIADLIGGAPGAELRAQSEQGMAALGWDSPRWLALSAARVEP